MPCHNIVYHGTNKPKQFSNPIIHRRTKLIDGNMKSIFNEKSFHASPIRWIALAYTYTPKTFLIDGKEVFYNIEIDLYENTQEIIIHGIESLEKSLSELYGDGGYILEFGSEHFHHKIGLGCLEVISKEILLPDKIIFIVNPVIELKKEHVNFKFTDLSKDKNQKYRNYK